MLDVTRTTTVLLEGLHDTADDASWSEFDRRYRPIVIGFARRLGLDDTEAADAAQETMARFLQEYRRGRYDRRRGRLRSWLIGLARYRVAEARRQRATRREVAVGAGEMDLEDDARLTRVWDAEQRSILLHEALDRLRTETQIREKTIRAFELLVVNQVPVQGVAEELGLSAQEVYLAKSRVAQRLRDILATLESAFEDDDGA